MFGKVAVVLLTLITIGFVAQAHPGPLDHRGGHNCWNQCEKYGLYQGEYHIHRESSQFHYED